MGSDDDSSITTSFRLQPNKVIALAKTIPNCCRVNPPPPPPSTQPQSSQNPFSASPSSSLSFFQNAANVGKPAKAGKNKKTSSKKSSKLSKRGRESRGNRGGRREKSSPSPPRPSDGLGVGVAMGGLSKLRQLYQSQVSGREEDDSSVDGSSDDDDDDESREEADDEHDDGDGDDVEDEDGTGPENEILSFLVSDPDDHNDDNGELQGAGIARVDVYCKTGTVCTCRVIQVQPNTNSYSSYTNNVSSFANIANYAKSEGGSYTSSLSPSTVLNSILNTPRSKGGNLANLNFDWPTRSAKDDASEVNNSSNVSLNEATSKSTQNTKSSTISNSANSTINNITNTISTIYNATPTFTTKSTTQTQNTHVRRIFRRKCNLEVLRKILECPPKLTKIDDSLLDHTSHSRHQPHGSRRGSMSSTGTNGSTTANDEVWAEMSKYKSKRQKKYEKKQKKLQGEKGKKGSKEKGEHMESIPKIEFCDENTRQMMAEAILSGMSENDSGNLEHLMHGLSTNMGGTGDKENGDDMEGDPETDSKDGGRSKNKSTQAGGDLNGDEKEADDPTQRSYQLQLDLREKIELADTGLAILMGEAEMLDKFAKSFEGGKKVGEEESTRGSNSISSRSARGTNADRSDRKNRTEKPSKTTNKTMKGFFRWRDGGKKSSYGSGVDNSSGSTTTTKNNDNDSFSTLDQSYNEGEEDSSSGDSEAERIARLIQGCEIEYSFPFEYHEELEEALLAESYSSSDEEGHSTLSSGADDASLTSSLASSLSSRLSRRRGRSPASTSSANKYAKYVRKNKKNNQRRRPEDIPSITSIPNNGEGCIVLRNNGGFCVVGSIPKDLNQLLFRPKGPLPEYIALGSHQRFYVRFDDGSYAFHGPDSLKKFLGPSNDHVTTSKSHFSIFKGAGNAKKGRKYSNKQKHKHKKQNKKFQHSIASIAFGQKFSSYFLVRSNGSWEANGDLPSSLERLLTDRGDRGDLLFVSLGSEGEWCVKARNGKVWWGGVSEEIEEVLSEVLIGDDRSVGSRESIGGGGGKDLKYIDFGVDESYFLMYQ